MRRSVLTIVLLGFGLVAIACTQQVPEVVRVPLEVTREITVVVEKEVVVDHEVLVTVEVERVIEVTMSPAIPTVDPSQFTPVSEIVGLFGSAGSIASMAERDAEHAILCYGQLRAPHSGELERLAELVESYPQGHLPRFFEHNRNYIRQFSRQDIEVWCNSIIQNVEERTLSQASDAIRRRHHSYAGEIIPRRWPNVATTLTDFENLALEWSDLFGSEENALSDHLETLAADRSDPMLNPYAEGDFERDVETWVRCVSFIDSRTTDNLNDAVDGVNTLIRRYYKDDFSGIETSSQYDTALKTGVWCLFFKGRIERRAVAFLAGEPVPLP